MSAVLTKKQQKALAFRAKQKAKKSGKEDVIPNDVPEQDLEEDDGKIAPVETKKRKGTEVPDQIPEKVDGETAKVKGKGKAKAKIAWDEDDEEANEEEGEAKKSKKEIKQRFILFVGNLSFKTTREDVQAHFTEAVGHQPAVRLLTTKTTRPSQPPKSRGIAFLELPSSSELQACLKLHHSDLQGRRINVELTAGGGGKGEGRKEKIKSRNERVGGQRERKAEREAEEGEGDEGVREEGFGTGGDAKRKWGDGGGVEVVDGPDGKAKIRGGRREKVKVTGSNDIHPSKRPRTDSAQSSQPQRGGYGGQQSGRGGFGSRPPRRKFEPTGANAVSVK